MMRPQRPAAVGAAMMLLVLALASRAWAGVDVGSFGSDRYPTVRVVVVTSKPTLREPAVIENGAPVVVRAQNLANETNVVVAIDRSRSMLGQSLVDASAAARAFVAAKPESNRVAIVAFGKTPVALTGFSSSTIDAEGALRSIEVDGQQGTALYDAIVLASDRLSRVQGGRVLVLLTDGQDVSSKASLETAIAAAKRAGVQVYPIAISGPGYSTAPLEQLASETGGTFHVASSSSVLRSVYAAIAAQLARTWTIEYETAVQPRAQLALRVTVPGEGTVARQWVIPATAGTTPTPPKPMFLPASVYKSPLATGVLVLAVAALLLLAVISFGAARKASWVRNRLDAHLVTDKRQGGRRNRRTRGAGVVTVLHATERVFGNLRQWSVLRRLLERADLPLRPAEFAWISVGAGFLVGLMFGVATGTPIAAGMGFCVGLAIPYLVVWVKARRRLAAFENQLPDLLLTLAASLKAGHSFRQGIQTIVEEGQPPAAAEFKRVLTDTQLGRSMEDSLFDMAERVGSKNFDFVITAVTIQRQVGGSLAGLFDMVADTVRQRQQFARRIKSLTAMGRMSAYVLIGLPFFMVAAMTAVNSTYMSPLFTTSTGHVMIAVALMMMAFGSLILKKIVSFKG
jgi:tight adherence protein B